MKYHSLEEAMKTHLERADLSQAAAARKLGYKPDQFNKWIRGMNRIPDIVIQEFSDLLHLSDEERVALFELAGYVAIATLNRRGKKISAGLNITFFINALTDWSDSFFRWSEASDHMRSSWPGMVIHIMSVVINRLTVRGLLIICLSLLLGMLTVFLVAPVLEWPLDKVEARQSAYLKYGLATWLIPLLVAFVTPPDRKELALLIQTGSQQRTFWILKFTGALTGFWVFSMGVIGLTLGLYYLYVASLPGIVRGILALIPLFFSYVAARRIPADRYKMFAGDLRLHPVDRLILFVLMFFGPFMASFCYLFYWLFADRRSAPLLLLTLSMLLLWEYRKQNRNAISEIGLILILGLFFPLVIIYYALFVNPTPPSPSFAEFPELGLASIYILSWTLLGATIFVRNKPILTLSGVFSLLGIVLFANLLLVAQRWLGGGFFFMTILIWVFWGQRRFRRYFWIHNSFWLMIVATGICVYLLLANVTPLWLNGLGFTIISMTLIGWAYRQKLDIPTEEWGSQVNK